MKMTEPVFRLHVSLPHSGENEWLNLCADTMCHYLIVVIMNEPVCGLFVLLAHDDNMSGLVCRLHVLLSHVDEHEWTCVQTPHIQRGTWASHVLMITSLAIRWANVREDSIENRCHHHHHHHHHCHLVSGHIYSSLFRLVQSGTGIWCWKPVTLGST